MLNNINFKGQFTITESQWPGKDEAFEKAKAPIAKAFEGATPDDFPGTGINTAERALLHTKSSLMTGNPVIIIPSELDKKLKQEFQNAGVKFTYRA